MVVVEVMRVMKNGDHELLSVLEMRRLIQAAQGH
jgi:hypothetical protein